MSGMLAAAGAIVSVLCLYLYWRVAARGLGSPGETLTQWLYFCVAVLQLVPIVGGVIFARNGSRFGTWLTWATLAGPIVWVGMKVVEAAL